MPLQLTWLNAALAVVVLATLIGFALLILAVVLASGRSRTMLVRAWFSLQSAAESVTVADRLKPVVRVFASIFENENGFSKRKFVVAMLIVNLGAIVARFMAMEIEQTDALVRRALSGNTGPSAGDDDVDDLAYLWISAILFAPFHLIVWSMLDLTVYRAAKELLEDSIQTQRLWPILFLLGAVLLCSYILPLVLFWIDWFPLAILANLTPLTPLLHALIAFPSCWYCSLLMLPAGLSVSVLVAFSGLLYALAMHPRVFKWLALLCEAADAGKPQKYTFWALNLITLAGGLGLLLTIPNLPWDLQK
jgi:hypothetical protein